MQLTGGGFIAKAPGRIKEKEIDLPLVNQVKEIIRDYYYNDHDRMKVNLSDFLSEKTGKKYSYISKAFRELTNQDIQTFTICLKIERTKELLQAGKTLTEISYELEYSSLAHLSGQFKKYEGITVSQYLEHLIRQSRIQ